MCKYLLDLDLTLMNIWRDNYCLENDYDNKMKLSVIFSILHINGNICDGNLLQALWPLVVGSSGVYWDLITGRVSIWNSYFISLLPPSMLASMLDWLWFMAVAVFLNFMHFIFPCIVFWFCLWLASYAGQSSLPRAWCFVQLSHIQNLLAVFWIVFIALVDVMWPVLMMWMLQVAIASASL